MNVKLKQVKKNICLTEASIACLSRRNTQFPIIAGWLVVNAEAAVAGIAD